MPLVSQTFDQLLDFTRTTSGTFVGSNGLIQTTPASVNLLTQTQQFDNAAWTKTAATVTANTTVAPDGTSTADTITEDTTAASAHRVFVSFAAAVVAHTASIYVKAGTRSWFYIRLTDSGNVQRYAYFNVGAGTLGTVETNLTASITDAGNGWYRCAATVSASFSTGTTVFGIADADGGATYNGNGTGNLFLWGAQLQTGSAATTYTRNNGGVFPPRFDYDPVTLAPKGILIEEQRTNLLTYSEQFDNAVWMKSDATVTANAAVSPDGASDADKLIASATAAVHGAHQDISLNGNNASTFSVYVKAAGYTTGAIRFEALSSPFNSLRLAFDLTAVTVTATAYLGAVVLGSSISSVGNGWFRVSITGTTGFNGNHRSYVFPNTGASFTGDGTSGMYFYGAQLEAGAFATSYIPTVASQVTRTADVCSIVAPNFAPWYNQSEGTFVFQGSSLAPATLAQTLNALAASDGTNNNIHRIGRFSNFWFGETRDGNVQQANPSATAGSYTQNATAKVAFAYKTNDFALSANGATAVTDTSGTVPTVMNRLDIGAPAIQLNGHIRSIRYYPVRLSDAQLQALTA